MFARAAVKQFPCGVIFLQMEIDCHGSSVDRSAAAVFRCSTVSVSCDDLARPDTCLLRFSSVGRKDVHKSLLLSIECLCRMFMFESLFGIISDILWYFYDFCIICVM